MTTAHKIKTERVNAGVIAECAMDGCTWPGYFKYQKGTGEPPNRTYVEVSDQVFPNRALAVQAYKVFHQEGGNNVRKSIR